MDERISFDRSLYRPEAVEAAAAAYADYIQVEVIPAADAVVAVISRVVGEHDPQTVLHAFCNHVLHETILRGRQAAEEVA
jgi:hypothetical protein